jgi:transporter family-2 protein
MSQSALWLVVPVGVGLCQPIIWQMNLRLARHTGDMESAVILHIVGAVFGLSLAAGGLRGSWSGGLSAVPWWAWLAGIIGVSCMALMNRAIPQIGVGAALAITVAAQMVAALLFEQGGWLGAAVREATWDRWLGAGLLALGAWLVSR